MSVENSKNPVWRERFFRYAPLILWIGVIFFLSSGQGAMSNTSRFIRPILEFLFPNSPEEVINLYHGYIRKLAHFTEYAVLAFFSYRTFYSSAQHFLRKFWFPLSFLLVFTVASLDEFNQSFLNSRTSSFRDVLLDTFGGFAMLTILLFYKTWRKNSQKPGR